MDGDFVHIRRMMHHIQGSSNEVEYPLSYFYNSVPELSLWNVDRATVLRERPQLLEYIVQKKICQACQGFSSCGKQGDMKGFVQTIRPCTTGLSFGAERCQPFYDSQAASRVHRWRDIVGVASQDAHFRFDNYPEEQSLKYPKLMTFARNFAESYTVGQPSDGAYLFGPPGVGKTHLMLAVFNRLEERNIPCLFLRSDTIFDRMRHILSVDGDLDEFLQACSSVPVLGVDEFAQERANDFTLEKLFRIINQRFHAKLPTWFTSNFSPPQIYRKGGQDLQESVAPLRSRILQMARLAKMDGEDHRQRHLKSLT